MHLHPLNALVAAVILATSCSSNTAAAILDVSPEAVLGARAFDTPAGNRPTASTFAGPGAMAEDPVTGELWVVDGPAHRVLRFGSAMAFTNGESANLVLGQANFTAEAANRGGTTAANGLASPSGVAVNQLGHVIVADRANNRLLIFKPPFTNGMDAADFMGQVDFTSNQPNGGRPNPTSGSLSDPHDVFIDGRGSLWVADTGNHRVLQYDDVPQRSVGAGRVWGQASSTTATPGLSATALNGPTSIAVKGDYLWVADAGNRRVVAYTGNSRTASQVFCQADFVSNLQQITDRTCHSPQRIAVDAAGHLYVSDTGAHRVLRFYTPDGNGARAHIAIGQGTFTDGVCNRGGPMNADSLCLPYAMHLDARGDLLLADVGNGRVLRYDIPRERVAPSLSGVSPTLMPGGSAAFEIAITGTGFQRDSTVLWDGQPRETQYLSDRHLVAFIPANDVVRIANFNVNVTTPGPGGGSSVTKQFTTYFAFPGDGIADRLLGQADFNSSGTYPEDVGQERVGLGNPWQLGSNHALAIDRNSGRLFVAASGRVLSWPNAASIRNGDAADIVLGQPELHGVACATSATRLCAATDIAIDDSGALWVTEGFQNRVVRFSPPFYTGKAADRVLGQQGSFTTFTANKGGRSAESLDKPSGIAARGPYLFVHDAFNKRVLVYRDPANQPRAIAAIGQADFTTIAPAATSATRFITDTARLAVDPAGHLYFASIGENRILRFSAPFATNMAADLVLGQATFTDTDTAAGKLGLATPSGMDTEYDGSLLIADKGNHRVLRYAAPVTGGAMQQVQVIGQPNLESRNPSTSQSGFTGPSHVATDGRGNLWVLDADNSRALGFLRPFGDNIDPRADADDDGIPNGVEREEERDPYGKDNDIFHVARLFAMQQYRDFLGREGDPDGIDGWTRVIDNKSMKREQVVQGFFVSPEFAGSVSPVVRLYFAAFLRVPDYGGLLYHAQRSRDGTAIGVIAQDFATGAEFVARYGGLNDEQFIEQMYLNVLGRPSDVNGKVYWINYLATHTRGDVLSGFAQSAEFTAATANKVFITMMYVGMLRRSPDAGGFAGWLAYLDAGNPRLDMTRGFLDAREYRERFLPAEERK